MTTTTTPPPATPDTRGADASPHSFDVALTAFAPAAWGTTYIVTTELLPPDRPLLAAALRALPAGLALAALSRRRPSGVWWWRAGVLGALNIGAFFALRPLFHGNETGKGSHEREAHTHVNYLRL